MKEQLNNEVFSEPLPGFDEDRIFEHEILHTISPKNKVRKIKILKSLTLIK